MVLPQRKKTSIVKNVSLPFAPVAKVPWFLVEWKAPHFFHLFEQYVLQHCSKNKKSLSGEVMLFAMHITRDDRTKHKGIEVNRNGWTGR